MTDQDRIDELETEINDCMVQIAEHQQRIDRLKADIQGMDWEIRLLRRKEDIIIAS